MRQGWIDNSKGRMETISQGSGWTSTWWRNEAINCLSSKGGNVLSLYKQCKVPCDALLRCADPRKATLVQRSALHTFCADIRNSLSSFVGGRECETRNTSAVERSSSASRRLFAKIVSVPTLHMYGTHSRCSSLETEKTPVLKT